MNKLLKTAIISSLIMLGTSCSPSAQTDPSGSSSPASSSKQGLFERVTTSKTIRCGYVVYPPSSIKDPNTGKLSGIFVETLEKAAENLGYKVEWVEEVSWGTMIEGLNTDRYDMIGSPVWANSIRAQQADFIAPLFYSGIGIFAHQGDTRFSNRAAINSPSVKIATIDGDMSDLIARSQFPKAIRVSLPQASDVTQLLLNVAQKKADITFQDSHTGNQFLKKNPNTIENIAKENPIRIFPNNMMIKQGEEKFKNMMDVAIGEVINSGYVDELIKKYEVYPGSFYRVAYPYRLK